ILTGYVRDDDLAALYTGARALVFPSLYEGFGLPALEAMACGTPVIASMTSSLPEVMGDAGVLVDPERTEDIARGIRQVLDNPGLVQELRSRGLERAQQFTWERAAAVTLDVLDRVGRHGGARAGGK